MKASKMLLCAAFAVAGSALTAGTALAEPEVPSAEAPAVDVVAGTNWMVVSVTPTGEDAADTCTVDPFSGTEKAQSMPVAATGNVFVDEVPAGTHTVSVSCPNSGTTTTTVDITS